MKIGLIILAAAAGVGAGTPVGQRITTRQITEDPRSYVGKKVVLPSIGCVDNPKGGFLCVGLVGGQALRIEALALGARTKQEIAERLIGDCKGTANLTRPACRVDAEIEPTSGHRETLETANGSMPIAIVVSPQIEMYAPARR